VLGVSIAAPVGAIGVLCIRRTLAEGRWVGLATGMGAATADAVYGAFAAFGIGALASLLTSFSPFLRLFGGAFLLYLGIMTLRAKPPENTEASPNTSFKGLWKPYITTFALTLSNPMTIFAFIGIFAGLGVGATDFVSSVITVLGVFLGSAGWWVLLVFVVSLFRKAFTARWLRAVNLLSGGIICVFASLILRDLFLM